MKVNLLIILAIAMMPFKSMCDENIIDLISGINNNNQMEIIKRIEIIASDNNDIKAQYQLGKLYYDGMKVDRSYKLAAKWLLKAAENNNIESQLIIAEMYENGKGVFGDTQKSMKWYEKASEKNTFAQYKFGSYLFLKHFYDFENTELLEKGIKLLEKAGENGIADAYCLMAREYTDRFYSGSRQIDDDKKSIIYFNKAAKMYDIEAICERNACSGNINDYIGSIKEASNYGLGFAHYLIFDLFSLQPKKYLDKISRVEAYKSMLLAEKLLGHNIREEQKATIEKLNFTKEEIEEATRLANEWKPIPLPPAPVVKNP